MKLASTDSVKLVHRCRRKYKHPNPTASKENACSLLGGTVYPIQQSHRKRPFPMSTVGGLEKLPLRTTHQPVEIGAGKVSAEFSIRQATKASPRASPEHPRRSFMAKLQHSILSLWLRVTQAGITPACIQFISSTHVHLLVRHFVRHGVRTLLANPTFFETWFCGLFLESPCSLPTLL